MAKCTVLTKSYGMIEAISDNRDRKKIKLNMSF